MYARHASVVIVNPGGTGRAIFVISARFAPVPPSRSFWSLSPSLNRNTNFAMTALLAHAAGAAVFAAPGSSGGKVARLRSGGRGRDDLQPIVLTCRVRPAGQVRRTRTNPAGCLPRGPWTTVRASYLKASFTFSPACLRLAAAW